MKGPVFASGSRATCPATHARAGRRPPPGALFIVRLVANFRSAVLRRPSGLVDGLLGRMLHLMARLLGSFRGRLSGVLRGITSGLAGGLHVVAGLFHILPG